MEIERVVRNLKFCYVREVGMVEGKYNEDKSISGSKIRLPESAE